MQRANAFHVITKIGTMEIPIVQVFILNFTGSDTFISAPMSDKPVGTCYNSKH